jgi:hypothetical protein
MPGRKAGVRARAKEDAAAAEKFAESIDWKRRAPGMAEYLIKEIVNWPGDRLKKPTDDKAGRTKMLTEGIYDLEGRVVMLPYGVHLPTDECIFERKRWEEMEENEPAEALHEFEYAGMKLHDAIFDWILGALGRAETFRENGHPRDEVPLGSAAAGTSESSTRSRDQTAKKSSKPSDGGSA